jgi:hypothetical protein
MGYWQISAACAKIVSHFSLETNGYRLGFRASPEGRYTCCSLRSPPPIKRMEPISCRLASGLRLAAHPPRRWAPVNETVELAIAI